MLTHKHTGVHTYTLSHTHSHATYTCIHVHTHVYMYTHTYTNVLLKSPKPSSVAAFPGSKGLSFFTAPLLSTQGTL